MPSAVGEQPVEVSGAFAVRNGRELYEIQRVADMPPFLMTVVGDTDLWMYLSSAGAFTAGRVEPDRCVFPYETDDRLHDLGGITGPVTIIRFESGRVWRPFDTRPSANRDSRVLRRSPIGDLVEFEETDEQTGLVFRVEYSLVDSEGIVRRATLSSGGEPVSVELLDGYRNVMPARVNMVLQQQMSTLVDGYKRSEMAGEHGPAVFVQEAAISDSPQPKETLHANVVWHVGLEGAHVSLDDAHVGAFESGCAEADAGPVTGRRGAYLLEAAVTLAPGESESWAIVADADLDQGEVVAIRRRLDDQQVSLDDFGAMIDAEHERLSRLLAAADAAQVTGDAVAMAAHQSNVLFNLMRGGVPIDGYRVDADDFRRSVRARNADLATKHADFLEGLESPLSLASLQETVAAAGDPQLERVALEYLPLTFGRRHGDPSRPWNRFRIRVRDEHGQRVTGYEGNWRDIFQNWEATCRSYPAMLPGVIAKFLNATNAEGYNPYRISEQGIDWEAPEPDNPRSNIGYWGDHQIVYLHRLLKQCDELDPSWLRTAATQPIFSYAQIPYRIKSFDEIASNPRESIEFDEEQDKKLRARMAELGADGNLYANPAGEPVLVTLLEKLLPPALAKVANLVPGGGVWMNMQRPEWNDANNALAGYGLSMVTLYQLRSYADWCIGLVESLDGGTAPVSKTIAEWCNEMNDALVRSLEAPATVDDETRWNILESLGRVADRARQRMATGRLGAPVEMEQKTIADFFRLTRHLCDRSIADARREDGLYESYRVLHLGQARAAVESLEPMLEGQVSILAAGVLDEAESIRLLDALFESPLYREDQRTFILYPRTDRQEFLARNVIPSAALNASPLLLAALDNPEWGLAKRDDDGAARFNGELIAHEDLRARLDRLEQNPEVADLIAQDGGAVSRAFERTFVHARFTGRSSTMHKYEGLGSVYWHMVSKLLLAIQESVFLAVDRGSPQDQIDALRTHYNRVRDGLGFRKSPAEFGAVPFEPYSHTPWRMGAQQPGMTGQVKEGVLARYGELGIRLRDGRVRFDPTLIDAGEFLDKPARFTGAGVEAPAGGFGFTVCNVPIVVVEGDTDQVRLSYADGSIEEIGSLELTPKLSKALLRRDGALSRVSVTFKR